MPKQAFPDFKSLGAGMRFVRQGGVAQLLIEAGSDIRFLRRLDPSLWGALSCPAEGLEFDARTLAFLDTDQDGRIRYPEVIAAAEWLQRVLTDLKFLETRRSVLPLSAINVNDPDGQAILTAARRILINCGTPDATEISLEATLGRTYLVAAAAFNGDGVIVESEVEDAELQQAIATIRETVGGARDLSGVDGIGEEALDRFYTELERYRKWKAAGVTLDAAEREKLLPFGEKTAEAWHAFHALERPVDRFFHAAALAGYGAAAETALNPPVEAWIGENVDEGKVPVARVKAKADLPLREGIHPVYAARFEKFRQVVVAAAFPEAPEVLTHAEWQSLKNRFAAYRKRLLAKSQYPFETIPEEQLAILERPETRPELARLIQLDRAAGEEISAIKELERLLRYCRDFLHFCNNFVSFPDFYALDKQAIFQAGEMLIDGRHLKLCLAVKDLQAHAAMAGRSGIYMIYCEIWRGKEAPPRLIAAAVTSGDAGRLHVGKNGVFRDRQGRDWEARVVHVLARPISLLEATLAPFRRLGKLISSQIEKLADSREQEMQQSVAGGIGELDRSVASQTAAGAAPAAAAAAPNGNGRSLGAGGIIAGSGFAIAAVGSSFAIIADRLSSIGTSGVIYATVVILLFLLIPSLIVGFFRLRARDLGDVLEANAWAINGKLGLSFILSRRLTSRGRVPPGASRTQWGVRWPFQLVLVISVILLILQRLLS